jgi:hypothetical protein
MPPPPATAYRQASVAPSGSLSPPPSTASPSSQIYSESLADDPSFLSEDPSTASSSALDHADADSLVDASPEEVEARALELLTLDSAADLSHTADEGSKVTISDIPRCLPVTTEGRNDGQANAVAFLRKCVQEAEDTDWMFNRTPAVFGPPRVLDPRAAYGQGEEDGSGLAHWLDTAFNLESYQPDDHDDGATTVELEDSGRAGLEFRDLAPSGFGGGYGTPYVREGEADPVFA